MNSDTPKQNQRIAYWSDGFHLPEESARLFGRTVSTFPKNQQGYVQKLARLAAITE